MQKIPMPVAIGLAVVAVLALGFAIFNTFGRSGGDTASVQSINREIQKQTPSDVPKLPADQTPAAHGQQMGKGHALKQ